MSANNKKSPELMSSYSVERYREGEIRIYHREEKEREREICIINGCGGGGKQGGPAPLRADSDQREGGREQYEPFTGVLSTSSRACASAVDASGGRDVSIIEAESGRGSDGGSESGMGGSREGEEDER